MRYSHNLNNRNSHSSLAARLGMEIYFPQPKIVNSRYISVICLFTEIASSNKLTTCKVLSKSLQIDQK